MEDFPYVLRERTKPRIGFGTLISTGDSPWLLPKYVSSIILKPVKSVRLRDLSRTFPVTSLTKKYPSIYGHAAFVSEAPRLSDIPKSETVGAGAYNLDRPKSVKQSYKPFNCGSTKDQIEPKFATPGPPTYPYHEKLSNYSYCIGFGKKRRIWPATAVFCSVQNTAKCSYCQKQPEGDYLYNFKTKLSLCRRCFKWQYLNATKCSPEATDRAYQMRELKEFKPARYCDFYHKHTTDKVASQLITTTHLKQKIRTENYLFLYKPFWHTSVPWKTM